MKSHFWSTDWFIGLIITITVVFSSGSSQLQSLEREAYDWGVRSTERFPSEKIAVIAIDDVSIANIGRWPWPRDVHAEMIKQLAEGGAKVIGANSVDGHCQRLAGALVVLLPDIPVLLYMSRKS